MLVSASRNIIHNHTFCITWLFIIASLLRTIQYAMRTHTERNQFSFSAVHLFFKIDCFTNGSLKMLGLRKHPRVVKWYKLRQWCWRTGHSDISRMSLITTLRAALFLPALWKCEHRNSLEESGNTTYSDMSWSSIAEVSLIFCLEKRESTLPVRIPQHLGIKATEKWGS